MLTPEERNTIDLALARAVELADSGAVTAGGHLLAAWRQRSLRARHDEVARHQLAEEWDQVISLYRARYGLNP